jgi:hypothetical protein
MSAGGFQVSSQHSREAESATTTEHESPVQAESDSRTPGNGPRLVIDTLRADFAAESGSH